MKKIILFFAFALLLALSSFGQAVSRATLTTTPYSWGMRTVPTMSYLVNTFASFWNIVDDGGPTSFWKIGGNAVASNTSFIGSTTNYPLNFKVNNVLSGVIDTIGDTYFGYKAGKLDPATSQSNTCFGSNVLISSTSGVVNTMVGSSAGSSPSFSGGSNCFFGYNVGRDNTSGGNNSYFGESAGRGNTTGSDNTYIGKAAGLSNVGTGNVFLGLGAGRYFTAASNSFAVCNRNTGSLASDLAGSLLVGNFNGSPALQTLTVNAQLSTPFSFSAGTSGTITTSLLVGTTFTAKGTSSLQDVYFPTAKNIYKNNALWFATSQTENNYFGTGAGNTSGSGDYNTMVGNQSGNALSSGQLNTGLGRYTLNMITTETDNTAIGASAMRFSTGASKNTCIGSGSGNAVTSSANIFIGHGSGLFATTKGNELIISSATSRTTYQNDTTYAILYGRLNTTNSNANQRLSVNGGLKIYATTTLAIGTTAANTAPLKFINGPKMTTAEAGGEEFDTAFYQTKVSGLRYALGGAIFDNYADVNNSGTGETDLYSYTTPANTLGSHGSKIQATYSGTFNDLTATVTLKLYFAGTVIGNTGALTVSATGGWKADVLIIRSSSTTARAVVSISTPGASTAVYTTETDLTGLTLSSTNIIKITGTAGGASGGSNDITAKLATGSWMGKAAN